MFDFNDIRYLIYFYMNTLVFSIRRNFNRNAILDQILWLHVLLKESSNYYNSLVSENIVNYSVV